VHPTGAAVIVEASRSGDVDRTAELARNLELPMRTRRFALVAGVLMASTVGLRADDSKKGVDAKAALEKLKGLAGEWSVGEGSEHGAAGTKIKYRVIGAGSAVVEEQFPGSAHEMVSVYHLDGDELLMTHYCAAGNQPRMKLDRKASTPDKLIFVFDGGTNFDPKKDMHIHEARIEFKDDKHVNSYWTAYMDGKPMGEATPFILEKK
jgi:hypothetical protein